ncbi:MAG: dTDP-4-dehydrorhamnose 3,5-epimerase [Chlorobiaceae bacterium]|nr:dTDP-4-dehydrorhamnose 3,5-epimerase [Chlorobiaceae bacterium]
MKLLPTAIPEVLLFEPRVFGDDRGYFFESFRQDIFDRHAGGRVFVQENESFSRKGVLRGLHFQQSPYMQGKLVRVILGSVLDVAVDIRKWSPTFGRHVAEELSAANHRMMWVPPGFAHGFSVLSDTAVFSYKCDAYYAPESEAGIAWDDPDLGIDWRLSPEEVLVSPKDTLLPRFREIEGVDAQF